MSTEQANGKSSQEYESMRKTVMQKKSLDSISDTDLPFFVTYMNEYKMECLDKEDYLAAKDAAAILDACKAENTTRQTKTQTETQVETGTDTINKKKEEIEKNIQEFDKQTTEKQEQLKAQQDKELEEFETKWREEMPEKYRRISKKLVELRETARTLALAGHYDEAAARKTEADQLEAEEHKEAQNKLRHDYRIAKNKLLQKQKLETTKFNDSRQEKRNLFLAEIRTLEENQKNREFVLKSKPFANKRNVRDSQSEAHPSMLSRSLPRKTQHQTENKLPPLKPPNDKEPSPSKTQEVHKTQQTKQSSQKQSPKPKPPPKPAEEPKQTTTEQKTQPEPKEEPKAEAEKAEEPKAE